MAPDKAGIQALIAELEKLGEGGAGAIPPPPLPPNPGGGSYDPMEQRVTKLETHMEYVRRDLSAIDGKLGTLLERTADLPTKRDLSAFRWQWIATAVGAIALIVGGIIGGLSWIKPEQAPATPIVIQAQPAPVAAQNAPPKP